ncbi:hypothetical protein ACOSQ2_009727 [Xanthoceras sorbifolium]
MAARVYSSAANVTFDNTTTTAVLQYNNNGNYSTHLHQTLLLSLIFHFTMTQMPQLISLGDLEAYRFPSKPPLVFDFTAENLPTYLNTPKKGTEGPTCLPGPIIPCTSMDTVSTWWAGDLGILIKEKDALGYNSVDPPLQNTIAVPKNGWAAIRFKADDPGISYM